MPDHDAVARTFRHARREAVLVMTVWALALVWTVGYCYLRGYEHAPESWVVQAGLAQPRTPEDYRTYWGVPDWVAVGILLPWAVCTVCTVGFCVFVMTDDDLGREAEEAGHGH